jgi:hypothetical protein
MAFAIAGDAGVVGAVGVTCTLVASAAWGNTAWVGFAGAPLFAAYRLNP